MNEIILFQSILLFSSLKALSSDCCFMPAFGEILCKALCNNCANLQPTTQSFIYATSPFPVQPVPIAETYQTNPLPEPIPFDYVTQKSPPEYALQPLGQPYLPGKSMSGVQHGVPVIQQSAPVIPREKINSRMLYQKDQLSNTKERNIEDEQVAYVLDVIDRFYSQKLRKHESRKPISISQINITADSQCNNSKLKSIILQNTRRNLNTTKKLIKLTAEAQFGGHFKVICSNRNFSFMANSELFCQATKGNVSCYAYKLFL